MLKLFHSADSRSSRFVWLLEELDVSYELIYTDIRRRSGRGASDPANLHPDKRVPALVHDGELVTESAAIALYLTDTFPTAGLGPVIGSPGRAAYLTWLAFYAGEIEMAYAMYERNWIDLDPFKTISRDYARVNQRVVSALSIGPYLMGQHFGAVDILASGPYRWLRDFGPRSQQLDVWLERLAARPAAIRAAALDVQKD